MSTHTLCDRLKRGHVSENDSGIRYDPDSVNEIQMRNKTTVDLCLECPYPECVRKVNDDRRQLGLL